MDDTPLVWSSNFLIFFPDGSSLLVLQFYFLGDFLTLSS